MTPHRAQAALAEAVVRALAAGDVLALQRLVSPSVIDHSSRPGQPAGFSGVRERAMTLCAQMPDSDVVVDVLASDQDTVLARAGLTAVRRPAAPGADPTTARATVVLVLRFAGELLTELWTTSDTFDAPAPQRARTSAFSRVAGLAAR